MGRILGPDNEIELVCFTGSDLSGEEDVNIVQGSSLPEMKSAQQDRIMSLWTAGAIVNKQGMPDANAFLKLMGLGDANELFEQNQLDENKSKMENKIFERMAEDPQVIQMAMQQQQMMDMQQMGLDPAMMGMEMQPIPGAPIVRDFYDHEIHIYNHNMFRKSTAYEELPPPIQAIVDAHVAEHEAALQAPIIAQQQAEMEAQAAQEDKESQKEQDSKQQEHQNKMEQEGMKAQNAMNMAAIQAGTR
jgi:hypothetical protein